MAGTPAPFPLTCPVALHTATSSGGDVRFNLINPETNNRIRMVTTDPDTGPVERSSLVKRYAVAKDEYILLTDEEIKSVKLASTKTIDIERFVPEEEIERLYWDNPYYLAPAGSGPVQPVTNLTATDFACGGGEADTLFREGADENEIQQACSTPR